jgi:preprotein translocase subunit SecD
MNRPGRNTLAEGFDAVFFGFALIFVFIVLVAGPFIVTPL